MEYDFKTIEGTSEISGIVLAGGKNSRIGVKKAFLKINDVAIIDNIISIYRRIFSEIIIITNTPEDYEYIGVELFRDIILDKGSLGGLYTGLSKSTSKYCFIAACDMPLVSESLIRHIVSIKGYDVVIPVVDGRYEPLFALYSKNCLGVIEKQLKKGNLKIIDILPELKVKEIMADELKVFDEGLLSLINVNTFDEFKNVLSLSEEIGRE